MLARYSVRSSDSDGDVVTSSQTSVGSDAFSIAAKSRLSPVSATSEYILSLQLTMLYNLAATQPVSDHMSSASSHVQQLEICETKECANL